MGCGGSAELKELREEMKAMRAELEATREDRRQLREEVQQLHPQSQAGTAVAKPKSLMERRSLSLALPGALHERSDERSISDASTAATLDSLSVDLDALPIRAWYPEEKPKRRLSRCITEASPFETDVKVTIRSFKHLRFALEDAPVQPSEIAPSLAQAVQPAPARRRQRSCTESWGGDHSAAAEAEAAGLWTRRRTGLLEKAQMNLGSVEKAATTSDPVSPKRHRGRCRTRPSTWDATDLASLQSVSAACEGRAA